MADGDTLADHRKRRYFIRSPGKPESCNENLNLTLGSLDSLIRVVGSLFDPAVKNNFSSIIANLAKSSASLQMYAK